MADYKIENKTEDNHEITITEKEMREALRSYLKEKLNVEMPNDAEVEEHIRSGFRVEEPYRDGWTIRWTRYGVGR